MLFFGAVLLHLVESSRLDAELRMTQSEAFKLYDSVLRFEEQNGHLPGSGEVEFDRAELEPLRRRGYYTGSIAAKLVDNCVDAYVVNSREGHSAEFWMELTLDSQPETRFLLARSDDAPLGGGVWREGVFLYRDGKLRQVRQ